MVIMLFQYTTGTDAERLYVAVIRKRATADASEHLMVTDKKQHIVYITTKVARLSTSLQSRSTLKVSAPPQPVSADPCLVCQCALPPTNQPTLKPTNHPTNPTNHPTLKHQFANLLGFPHPKSLIKTEFTRFMAQPFMQLHSKWMRVSGAVWGPGAWRSRQQQVDRHQTNMRSEPVADSLLNMKKHTVVVNLHLQP